MSTTQSPDPNDRQRSASGAATETMEAAPQKPDRPSMLQMTVSALTAVSATALLSFVGVWGTVFGMGLLSILTVLGNYMYSSFIQRTAEKVKQARPAIPRPRGTFGAATETRPLDDATRLDLEPITAEQLSSADNGTTESTHVEDEDERPAGRLRTAWNSMVERYGVRRIVLSIVAVFVVLAGTVTVIEMVAGKPMSGIVRNDSGSGTSVFGGNTSQGSGTDESSDPDGDSDQQNPQEGDPQEEPPADEQQQDEPPADEPPTDDEPGDQPAPEDEQQDEPQDEEPPADEPDDEQPPAEEPQQEEPRQEEPPADVQQQDAPPAE